LENDLVEADGRIDGLSGAFAGFTDDVTAKFGRTDATINSIQTLTVPSLAANTSFVLSQVKYVEEDLQQTEQRVDALASRQQLDVQDLKASVDATNVAATALTGRVVVLESVNGSSAAVAAAVKKLQDEVVPGLAANTTFVLNQVKYVEEDLQQTEQRVDALASKHQADIAGIQDTTSGLTGRVVALESLNGSSIVGLAAAVKSLQEQLNDTHRRYDAMIADLKAQLKAVSDNIKPQCKEKALVFNTQSTSVDHFCNPVPEAEGLSPGATAGVAVASLAGGAILLGLAMSWYKKRKAKYQPLLSMDSIGEQGLGPAAGPAAGVGGEKRTVN